MHSSQYVSVFPSHGAAVDNTPMHKDKRGPVAKWLDAYAREPANIEKYVHQKGAHKGKVNGNKLAPDVGLSQSILSRILNGEIATPTADVIERIASKTDRPAQEIRGEAIQEVPNLTPTAIALARSFDELPEAARVFAAQMIASVLVFQREQPALAKLMFAAPDPKKHAAQMRRIEEWQDANREG